MLCPFLIFPTLLYIFPIFFLMHCVRLCFSISIFCALLRPSSLDFVSFFFDFCHWRFPPPPHRYRAVAFFGMERNSQKQAIKRQSKKETKRRKKQKRNWEKGKESTESTFLTSYRSMSFGLCHKTQIDKGFFLFLKKEKTNKTGRWGGGTEGGRWAAKPRKVSHTFTLSLILSKNEETLVYKVYIREATTTFLLRLHSFDVWAGIVDRNSGQRY